MIALRFLLYVSTGGLYGTALFILYALQPDERRSARQLAPMLAGLTVASMILSLLAFWVSVANMMDVNLSGVDLATFRMMASSMAVGKALLARLAALALALVAILVLRRSTTAVSVVCSLLGAIAIGTLAWNGHGAAGEGLLGWVRLASDIAHMLAGFAWLGALLMFLWLVRSPEAASVERAETAHHALSAFAVAGTIIVAILVASGLANALLIIGLPTPAAFTGSDYGWLLMLKLALFASMFGLAALNRFRLTPTLGATLMADTPVLAIRALRRSLAIELAVLLGILTVVSQLGTLQPGY